MNEKRNKQPRHNSMEPRSSPQTDPTNPAAQESVGVFVPAEKAVERRNDEPGITDKDRLDRDPAG